jgi:hypothetical protein
MSCMNAHVHLAEYHKVYNECNEGDKTQSGKLQFYLLLKAYRHVPPHIQARSCSVYGCVCLREQGISI